MNNGSITFSVVSQKDKIQIKIQDTGIGIEAQEINKIFDSFYRTEASMNSQKLKEQVSD